MSGHSKWSTIKRKKGVTDAKRGKIFTQHAKMIALAAQQGGGDLNMNPSLRVAVDLAKADNVPNINIDRAIKKGTGELKDGMMISEVTYEGYGPGGVALLVHTITDNKNRTLGNVRQIFTKYGGKMGAAGCVGWMFVKKGVIHIPLASLKMEDVEMAVIDSGAEDMKQESETLVVTTEYDQLMSTKKSLESKKIPVESAKLENIPSTTVPINDLEMASKLLKFMDALDEDEDVSEVSSNFEIAEEIMGKL
jgi:YebC/PmpR family DNA-binding regulatory protein